MAMEATYADASSSSSGAVNSNTVTCDCIIQKLTTNPFNSLNFCEKLDVVTQERPTPELPNLFTKTKKCIRHFKITTYKEIKWLCGCEKMVKLFCWPCILFSPEKSVWNSVGFNDLNNLHKAKKRHELAQSHITSAMKLKQFGKTRIEIELSSNEQVRLDVQRHNENVKNNKYVLCRLIDVACFLGKQELAFRGRAESSNNFVELVHAFAEHDFKLKHHITNSAVFSGLSNDLQNDIILAVFEVMMDAIRKEIDQTPFIAIMLDETTDKTGKKPQLSTIFRYVTNEGHVQERFLEFSDVDDHTASALAKHVFKMLDEFNCKDKLIAQTYDGAAVMANEITNLQVCIREECESALFVHSYNQKLNLVLSDSVKCIKQCKIFFMALSGFANFFSKSANGTMLYQLINERFPNVAPNRWHSKSRLVETINEHKEGIKDMLNSIIENGENWDAEIYQSARGLSSSLQDFDFIFVLEIFSSVFSMCDTLFLILQKKIFDVNYCISKIEEFKDYLQSLKEDFDNFWEKLEENAPHQASTLQRKNKKRLKIDIKTCYRSLYLEIIDALYANTTARFSDIDKQKFFALLDTKEYQNYNHKFPEEAFTCLQNYYDQHFDFPLLRNELCIFYKTDEFLKDNLSDVLHYMKSSNMDEVYKLLLLILTIPAISIVAERSSTLKRIKAHLRHSQALERPSALSMLGIEKELLSALRQSETFHDAVIDIFGRKERRMISLKYK